MEFLTPEEIAEKVVFEVRGGNTGVEVIGALDGAVMDPTYKAGYIREQALAQLRQQETKSGTPSIALGELGPPQLSKLLWEAELLSLEYGSISAVLSHSPERLASDLTRLLLSEAGIEQRTVIASTGLPTLLADGVSLLRGPRISIPEAISDAVNVGAGDIDTWAEKGWVDLRAANMERWQEWFRRMLGLGEEQESQVGQTAKAVHTLRDLEREAASDAVNVAQTLWSSNLTGSAAFT